jgi:two-component system, OmpR family, sensor kinase
VHTATSTVERIAPRRGQRRADRGGWLPDAELRHEARAVLFGIEAAASGLTHHRLLAAEQIDELSQGLVAEVRRLLALLDGRSSGATCFDLYEAITPVLTCARADGLDVRSNVPPGIEVAGSPDGTAQVLVALLTNAQRHAPGSPVEVRAARTLEGVVLYVEDRGPGVPASLQERVFERHMRAVGSDGSGLGLFIARRLMEAQNGTIAVRPREGGGSSFVLGFDPLQTRVLALVPPTHPA